MWIRTQNRKRLVDAICFTTSSCRIYADAIGFEDYVLGTYPTEARAIEVLDEIQENIIGKLIIPHDVTYEMYDTQVHVRHEEIKQLPTVYEMPKE